MENQIKNNTVGFYNIDNTLMFSAKLGLEHFPEIIIVYGFYFKRVERKTFSNMPFKYIKCDAPLVINSPEFVVPYFTQSDQPTK